MKKNRLSFMVSTKPMFIMIGLFFMLFMFYAVYREWVTYRNDLDYFERTLYDEVKVRLKIDVENRVEEFDYLLSRSQQRLYERMEENARTILIEYDYHIEHNHLSATELEQYLHYRVTQGSPGLLGELYTTSGLRVHGENEAVIRSPFNEVESAFGHSIIEQLLENNDDVGKVWLDDQEYVVFHEQIGDYVIVHGGNYTKYQICDLTSVIQRFVAYYQDRDDYIFMINKSGDVLLHHDNEAMGKNIDTDLSNTYFNQAFEHILLALETQDETFLDYDFYADERRSEISIRTAYIYYYEPLDIIVGKSVPETLFNPEVEAFTQRSIQSFIQYTLPLYVLLVSSAIGSGVAIFHYTKQSEKVMIEEDALHRKIAGLSDQLIIIADAESQIVFMNTIGDEILGHFDKVHNQALGDYLIERENRFYLSGLKQQYIVKIKKEPITYQLGKAYLYFIEDITDEVSRADLLLQESYTDVLTQLPNRRKLIKDFDKFIHALNKKNQPDAGALAIIDLDRFKRINDLHGHEYGDQVLKRIAELFLDESQDACVFYRIGGDEFAALTTFDKKNLVKSLESIRTVLSKQDYSGLTLDFTYGIAEISSQDIVQTFSEYYSRADRTLYSFKQSQKNIR